LGWKKKKNLTRMGKRKIPAFSDEEGGEQLKNRVAGVILGNTSGFGNWYERASSGVAGKVGFAIREIVWFLSERGRGRGNTKTGGAPREQNEKGAQRPDPAARSVRKPHSESGEKLRKRGGGE